MRISLFTIGAIIFMVGAALMGTSLLVNPNFHDLKFIPTAPYTTQENGLYLVDIPSNLTGNVSHDLSILLKSNLSQSAIVPASDAGIISQDNFTEFNVVNETIGFRQVYFNNLPPGSYYFVEPRNASVQMFSESVRSLELTGYTGTGGLYTLFAGIITIGVGYVIRRR